MSPPTPVRYDLDLVGSPPDPSTEDWVRARVIGDSMDLARGLRHDSQHSAQFQLVHDRRGQPLLARDERDGGVRAVVPGGVRLSDRPDDLDAPMLWRLAYWHRTDAFLSDLPPAFVVDTTLRDVVRRHPLHADWLLTRAARQLRRVASFMSDDVDPHAQTVAERRTLFVYLELEAAADHYLRSCGEGPPPCVFAALGDARSQLRGPAIAGITVLCTAEGGIRLRQRRLLGVVRRTRWNGAAWRPGC